MMNNKTIVAFLLLVLVLTCNVNGNNFDENKFLNHIHSHAVTSQNVIDFLSLKGEFSGIPFYKSSSCLSIEPDTPPISLPVLPSIVNNVSEGNTLHVFFLCGWQCANVDFTSEMLRIKTALENLYSNYNCTIKQLPWDCGTPVGLFEMPRDFLQRARNADEAGRVIAQAIKDLPESVQHNIVLVGHSLGTRVIIRAMALLNFWNVKIHSAILMAAAIDGDDPDIDLALKTSNLPIISLIHPQDGALMMASISKLYDQPTFNSFLEGDFATTLTSLGDTKFLTGAVSQLGHGSYCERDNIVELAVANNKIDRIPTLIDCISSYKDNHNVENFLNYFESFCKREEEGRELIIPQAAPNVKDYVLDYRVWWTIEGEFIDNLNHATWTLQKHRMSDSYTRIVRTSNEKSVRMANGNIKYMKPAFERIKKQVNGY